MGKLHELADVEIAGNTLLEDVPAPVLMRPFGADTKWSDYTYDECPACGAHTGVYAPTYRWNMVFIDCPACGVRLQSAAVVPQATHYAKTPAQEFRWLIPE